MNTKPDLPTSSNRVVCQICHRFGHTALDCYHRMNQDYRCRHSPAHLAALAANCTAKASPNPPSTPTGSQIWLSDSGCNVHLTPDLAKIVVSPDYNGESHIAVGNGQPLPITHTGFTSICTGSSTFLLSNLLRVPNISANLLSVHQFCLDNSCVSLFDAHSFTIQDKVSGRVLFHGPQWSLSITFKFHL